MNTDTPRTDAVSFLPDGYGGQPESVRADYARQLERELSEANRLRMIAEEAAQKAFRDGRWMGLEEAANACIATSSDFEVQRCVDAIRALKDKPSA